jgi:periplasmic protein CpxP/Spy
MKKFNNLAATFLCLSALVLLALTASGQNQAAMSKAKAISQQLNLTPKQKAQVLPILADEGPKVEAIKNNSALSNLQKIQQIKVIHQQTDPQMKAILSPAQYEKLQAIRQQAIQEAIQKRRGR